MVRGTNESLRTGARATRTRGGAGRRIGGPQSGLGMALGQGLADRQAVPHLQGLAALGDLQQRNPA